MPLEPESLVESKGLLEMSEVPVGNLSGTLQCTLSQENVSVTEGEALALLALAATEVDDVRDFWLPFLTHRWAWEMPVVSTQSEDGQLLGEEKLVTLHTEPPAAAVLKYEWRPSPARRFRLFYVVGTQSDLKQHLPRLRQRLGEEPRYECSLYCGGEVTQNKGAFAGCPDAHFVCLDCLIGQAKQQLQAGVQTADSEFKLKCPCGPTLSCRRLLAIGSPELSGLVHEANLRQLKDCWDRAKEREMEERKAQWKKEYEEQMKATQEAKEHREVEELMKVIENDILTLKCPKCALPYEHVDGCLAMTCDCGAHFCSICQADCGRDAHGHVASQCRYGPFPGMFISKAQVIEQNKRHQEYLAKNFINQRAPHLFPKLKKELERRHGYHV
jgi:hypothetical protein